MNKYNYVARSLSTIGLSLILAAMLILNGYDILNINISDSVAISADKEIKESSNDDITVSNIMNMALNSSEEREIAEAVSLRLEVFDGLTMDELSAKLDRSLGNAALAGKGNLIASYCLSKGVDPYLATAIMIHETGRGTSTMARQCNNVAGQKGSPSCMGSYKGYATIDDGIRGAIDNLYNNYYARGLNTPETIGPKYAESGTWVSMINGYINSIRNK